MHVPARNSALRCGPDAPCSQRKDGTTRGALALAIRGGQAPNPPPLTRPAHRAPAASPSDTPPLPRPLPLLHLRHHPGPAGRRGAGAVPRADEVVAIAAAGAEIGCKEALFTLGDRSEQRWPQARQWLGAHGFDSTLGYLRAMAIRVLEETGLLPHLNPGVMTWEEMVRLKPVAPSMGMMLETTSPELFERPGGAHYGSPDKDPDVRLRVLEDAGRLSIPFTTGILVGIGERPNDRVESLFTLRRLGRAYGHLHEIIVQNFRAKPDTAMRSRPHADPQAYLATLAVTRLVLGPSARIQAPPNLSEPDDLGRLLGAGVDDWGGVSPLTPDHVNPERPWPHLDELAARTAEHGFALRERLAVHPGYLAVPWLDPRLRPHVEALAGPDGLAVQGRVPVGRPWQEPDGGWVDAGRVDLHAMIDTTGRATAQRGDVDAVYGDWEQVGAAARAIAAAAPAAARLDAPVRDALRQAERNPAGLDDAQALALATAEGEGLGALVALADGLRRDAVGKVVTYVVTRNINFTNVCYTGCRFCALAQRRSDADAYTLSVQEVGQRAEQAWDVGATEICMQGGIDPDLPGTAYFDLAREIKRRVPGIHLHCFSPMEVVNGAGRTGLSIREFLQELRAAGVDSLPGTAAEILDDEVRWLLTKGKLPTATWVEVVSAAHEVGLPTSSTMMYGHVDTPAHWVRHLRVLAQVQDRTGGFTEFVPLPFVHQNAPIYLAGLARPGPTHRDNIAVHALARVMLHARVPHVQTSWVKLGAEGAGAMLGGGADDLGGTLMEETISRMAGSSHGSAMTPRRLEAIAASVRRPVRQRTTTYGEVSDERRRTSRAVRDYVPLATPDTDCPPGPEAGAARR